MKIGKVSQGKGPSGAKRSKGGSGSGFADQLRGASSSASTPTASGVTNNASIDGVDALLAMQEVGDTTDREARKKVVNYGEDLLDRLYRIQDSLLAGGIPKDQLMTMAQKLRAGRASISNPKLNSLIDEIELRVEVEIAKYTRRP
ncbi:MAG: flagellar assembly protein FliX [Magnetovibrio sp.]|nr:flagellar assembly protein FliX [Magnetovibrio sp.]